MNAREAGERLATIETVLIGPGDGSDGLVKRFKILEDKVNSQARLMVYLAAGGGMVGFILGLLTPALTTKIHF
jgi:hypothetical protein